MATDLLVTVVDETGYSKSAAHYLQAVRHSDWTIVWRPAAGTERLLHTWCDRCSSGLVIRPSGLLADRVTHRCPRVGREENATRLPSGGGSSPFDSDVANGETWEIRDE